MNGYKVYRLRKAVCSTLEITAILILLIVLLMQPIFAYSYDKNYLDYSSWDESNINTVAIDCEGAMANLAVRSTILPKNQAPIFYLIWTKAE